MKRFYKTVQTDEVECGHEILLDGKVVKTPLGRRLCLPNAELAKAIASEWRDQVDGVSLDSMPLTGFSYGVLDRVADSRSELVDQICAFGGADLICYRAGAPADLIEAQKTHLEPLVRWAESRFDAPLSVTTGIRHVEQSDGAMAGLRNAVEDHNNFVLAALYSAVSITGSLVIGLAISDGYLSGEAAWEASRIDENYQKGRWGEDAEANAEADSKKAALLAAARFIGLVGSVR
jgi:chaperone required for assembly of F1-ATPase